jgi:hypothetical protein
VSLERPTSPSFYTSRRNTSTWPDQGRGFGCHGGKLNSGCTWGGAKAIIPHTTGGLHYREYTEQCSLEMWRTAQAAQFSQGCLPTTKRTLDSRPLGCLGLGLPELFWKFWKPFFVSASLERGSYVWLPRTKCPIMHPKGPALSRSSW